MVKRKKELSIPTYQDTPESLQGTDIAHRAIDVANAAINGLAADEDWNVPTDPEQAKIALAKYKAAVAALNAANGIVKTKMQLFKLVGLDEKFKKLRKKGERL